MISQKVMLVTGSSRGIGASIAQNAARQGYFVVVNYNSSQDRAKEICKNITELGGSCMAVKADISDEKQVEEMKRLVLSETGRIDVLVNNAGISSFCCFDAIDEAVWDRTFDVNVKGAFLVTKAFVPQMIHEKKGKIINISSIWGLVGSSCEVHYSASKAALIGMTKALSKELGPSGITVNCVAPGLVDTEMNASLSSEDIKAIVEETPLGRIGNADEIAKTVLYLASDSADYITGQVLSPNGGLVIY